MWSHRRAQRVFLDMAVLPSGNVHVLAAGESHVAPAPRAAEPSTAGRGWVIHDAAGAVLGPELATRSQAMHRMGALACRGANLPLTLYGPDGLPTGDRLA